MSFFSIFIILAINMLLSFVLLYASVQINCINIRNAAKMELNNVSARIYADTFHSQREANLTSYMADINLSTAYKNALRAGFIEGKSLCGSKQSCSSNKFLYSEALTGFIQFPSLSRITNSFSIKVSKSWSSSTLKRI